MLKKRKSILERSKKQQEKDVIVRSASQTPTQSREHKSYKFRETKEKWERILATR